jgi:hypothetical protein
MPLENDQFGFFQQFRPGGVGVERLFADVPNGEQYVSRLREVYQATSDPACAKDLYFVVRSPREATDEELRALGDSLLLELRGLAKIIDNEELSMYLQRIDGVELVPKQNLNRNCDDNLLVMEEVGDWLREEFDDSVLRMREAYYSIACDFFLTYYLQWPSFSMSRDVFRPYFALWRCGADVSFEGPCLQIGRQEWD